jgi:hypothetical protein
VDTLTLVDTVGAGKTLHAEDGELRLHLTGDTVYLVGVSPDLAKQATRELNPQRWPEPARPPRTTRTIHQLSAPPAFDGSLDTWQPMTQLAMINPKVSGEDCSGMGYLGWDRQCLYVAVDMRDNEVLNKMPSAKLYQQDSLELFVSTEPRENHSGYGPHDYLFFITPSSAEGKPVVGEVADREAVKLAPVKDVKYQIGKTAHGWRAQVAIPWSTFADFQPAPGAKLALEMRVNDADTSHPRFKIDPMDGNVAPADPTVWSYLVLEK